MKPKRAKGPTSAILAILCIIAIDCGANPRQALSDDLPIPMGKVCVEFEDSLTVKTTYNVGDTVVKFHGITVSVTDFTDRLGGTQFGVAEIDNTAMPRGSGQNVRTKSANLLFDFGGVGFYVGTIMFAFLDAGGEENLAVDGGVRLVTDLSLGPSSFMLDKAKVSVFPPTPTINKAGTVLVDMLGGPVKNFEVGGQEFWIDRVCILPQQ